MPLRPAIQLHLCEQEAGAGRLTLGGLNAWLLAMQEELVPLSVFSDHARVVPGDTLPTVDASGVYSCLCELHGSAARGILWRVLTGTWGTNDGCLRNMAQRDMRQLRRLAAPGTLFASIRVAVARVGMCWPLRTKLAQCVWQNYSAAAVWPP